MERSYTFEGPRSSYDVNQRRAVRFMMEYLELKHSYVASRLNMAASAFSDCFRDQGKRNLSWTQIIDLESLLAEEIRERGRPKNPDIADLFAIAEQLVFGNSLGSVTLPGDVMRFPSNNYMQRKKIMKDLVSFFRYNCAIALCGNPKTGKTSMLNQLRSRFPHKNYVCFDARGCENLEELISHLKSLRNIQKDEVLLLDNMPQKKRNSLQKRIPLSEAKIVRELNRDVYKTIVYTIKPREEKELEELWDVNGPILHLGQVSDRDLNFLYAQYSKIDVESDWSEYKNSLGLDQPIYLHHLTFDLAFYQHNYEFTVRELSQIADQVSRALESKGNLLTGTEQHKRTFSRFFQDVYQDTV